MHQRVDGTHWQTFYQQLLVLFKSKDIATIKASHQSLHSGIATDDQMKLFVSEGNPHCLKVLAALEVTGVQCDVQYVNHEGKTAWLA